MMIILFNEINAFRDSLWFDLFVNWKKHAEIIEEVFQYVILFILSYISTLTSRCFGSSFINPVKANEWV